MSGWLYLIRNRDLYKIGITKNFDSRMRQLNPDNIVMMFAEIFILIILTYILGSIPLAKWIIVALRMPKALIDNIL